MERVDRSDAPESNSEHDAHTDHEHESHATTGGAAAAGAVTGGVVGLTGGPVGAIVGAVGGAIIGVAAERMMHGSDESDDDEPLTAATYEAEGIPSTGVEPVETQRPAEPTGGPRPLTDDRPFSRSDAFDDGTPLADEPEPPLRAP